MPKINAEDRERAIQGLRVALEAPGGPARIGYQTLSAGDSSHVLQLLVVTEYGRVMNVSGWAANITGRPMVNSRHVLGVRVRGSNFKHGQALVEDLSQALYGDAGRIAAYEIY